MREDPNIDEDGTEPDSTPTGIDLENAAALAGVPVTSAYKVLGQFEAVDGSAVLGQNDAQSGSPVGVEGAVPNASGGYGLSTPDDARLEGRVVSTSTHEIWVAGRTQLRLGPAGTDVNGNTAGGNVIGGFNDANGSVGSTIGGGGRVFNGNEVYDDYGTIGGGEGNQAGKANASGTGNAVWATVGGGQNNTANGRQATVGGGENNTASGEESTVGGGKGNESTYDGTTIGGGYQNYAEGRRATVAGGDNNYAFGYDSAIGGGDSNQTGVSGGIVNYYGTVPGGFENLAEGESSFAAGNRAKARDHGSFVWADRSGVAFASDQAGTGSSPTGSNTFHVRATGGVRFVTSLDSNDDPDAGAYLASGGSSWNTVSTRAVKHDVRPVDPQRVLDGVESLTVSRWAYDARPGVDRMGPMAGEFAEEFDLGDDPETIGHVDADGVALAAIQGLAARLEDAHDELDATHEELDEVREELAAKDARIDALEADNEALRERLAAVEARVSIAPEADQSGVERSDDD